MSAPVEAENVLRSFLFQVSHTADQGVPVLLRLLDAGFEFGGIIPPSGNVILFLHDSTPLDDNVPADSAVGVAPCHTLIV